MKISIITASYNYAQYIEEAINSVISQSYQDWELIIVDDGSSDNSVEIIKSYCEKDSRIKFFQHEGGQNKGLKETLLLGISHATGDWIAFLESDDLFMPDNLSKKIEIIQKYPNVNLIFNKVDFLIEKKPNKFNTLKNIQKNLSQMSFPKNMFYDFFLNNMILTFSCVMLKKSSIKSEYFNTPNDARIDWWLWIHLAYNNYFYYLDEKLTIWRLHDNSYIKQNKTPRFYLIQLKAYFDVYHNVGKPFKLLFFIYKSFFKYFFIKTFQLFVCGKM